MSFSLTSTYRCFNGTRMKVLLTSLLVLLTLPSTAQRHWVGVVGGVHRTNATTGSFTGGTDAEYRGLGGGTYEYFLSEHVSIGADLLYALRGFADSFGSQAAPEERRMLYYHYDYLALPLKVGLTDFREAALGFKVAGFAKLGLVPSWLIRAETELPPLVIGGDPAPARVVDVTDRVSPFDVAGMVEVGVGGNVLAGLWWTISATYQHSLTSISNDNYFSGISMRHNSVGLMVGLKQQINVDSDW